MISDAPDEIRWSVDNAVVATEPLHKHARWFEARWEVAATRRGARARALVDGHVVWEGPGSIAAWDTHTWWTVSVWRGGNWYGCNTGEFHIAEARAEVADEP